MYPNFIELTVIEERGITVDSATRSYSPVRFMYAEEFDDFTYILLNQSGAADWVVKCTEDIDAVLAKFEPNFACIKVTCKTKNSVAFTKSILLFASNNLKMYASGSDTVIQYQDAGRAVPDEYVVDETYTAIKTALTPTNDAFTSPNIYSNATGIAAYATGGQANATQLTEENNNVTTVATAGDSVKLMAAVAGLRINVKNNGAASMDVFPATGDSINALAVNLAIAVAPGAEVTFTAINGTVWETDNEVLQSASLKADTIGESTSGAGTTFSNLILTKSTTGITAFAGGGQGSATQLVSTYNEVTVCATAADSVKLAAAAAGLVMIVKNNGAASCTVYPATGDSINAGAVNAGYVVAPGVEVSFRAVDGTVWETSNQVLQGGDLLPLANLGANVGSSALRYGTAHIHNLSVYNSIEVLKATGTEAANAVTIDAPTGVITTSTLTTAAGAVYLVTLTNDRIATGRTVVASIGAYSGTLFTNGVPALQVEAEGAGTIVFKILNTHATNALNGTVQIHFHVL